MSQKVFAPIWNDPGRIPSFILTKCCKLISKIGISLCKLKFKNVSCILANEVTKNTHEVVKRMDSSENPFYN